MKPSCYCMTCQIAIPASGVTVGPTVAGQVPVTVQHHTATLIVTMPAPMIVGPVTIGVFPKTPP